MPDNTPNSNIFSKDELASLFSSDMGRLGTVTNHRNNKQTKGSSQKSKTLATASADNDISTLGSSETAFLLRQQQQQQRNQKSNRTKMQNTRYRAENHKQPSMMHQKQVDILAGITAAVVQSSTTDESNHLLDFDQKDIQINRLDKDVKSDEDEDEDEDDNFTQRRLNRRKSKKIIQSNKQSHRLNESDTESDNVNRNRYDSHERENDSDSSSSSESSSDSESESEDENAVDERRNRLRARVLVKKRDNLPSQPVQEVHEVIKKELSKETIASSKSKALIDDNSSKDEDSSSSDDSSSSSEDSSSEEEEIHVVAKPLFIPKSKRGIVKEANQIVTEEEQLQKSKEYKQNQTLQSRALVAQLLEKEKSNKSSQFSYNDEDDNPKSDDECGGTLQPPPDDNDDATNDPVEASKQRDSWQVRELLRILQIYDVLEEEKRAEEELKFRRGLTDAEIMALEGEGKKGKNDRTRNNKEKSQPKHMQRFYHRGAFYLDEDSLKNDPNDVRNKAKEYALAPTGEDKIDKRNLPKIMQVKKFGFAGYSTKYKGLKAEDTTDKRSTYIPLKRKRR